MHEINKNRFGNNTILNFLAELREDELKSMMNSNLNQPKQQD